MKILFVCQYFYPEVFRGNDIAFHWADEGHDVYVVCGIPNYPDGVFHEGYVWFKRRHEVLLYHDRKSFLIITLKLFCFSVLKHPF